MLQSRRIASILTSSSSSSAWNRCLSTVEASKVVKTEQKPNPERLRAKEKHSYLAAFRKRNAELDEKAEKSNLPWRIMAST